MKYLLSKPNSGYIARKSPTEAAFLQYNGDVLSICFLLYSIIIYQQDNNALDHL